jgi:DNA-binding MarR family transcriptional regulator
MRMMKKPRQRKEPPAPGRYAYEGLDRVLHERARLSILTSLLTHPDGLIFNDLKQLCALTDGNLSRHLDVLSDAGLVQVWKGFQGRRPQTLCRLTPAGRKRFIQYLSELERVVQDAIPLKAKSSEKLERRENRPAMAARLGWTPA